MQTATKGNTTWTYTYNADGLRTGKTNGTTTYTYTWNENRQLSSMTWNTGYALFYYDANGTPNSVVIDDGYDVQTYCYVTNLQGDIVGLISAESGDWAVTYEYDAWGNLLDKKGYSSGYAGAYVYNPLTYKGYLYDEETGFYYLQSRYYDSTVGRFLNADDTDYLGASGTAIGWNLFAYCENNPITNIDPNGTWLARIISAIVMAAALAILAVVVITIVNLILKAVGKEPIDKKTTAIIIASTAALGAVIGAVFGPTILAKLAPQLLKALQKLETTKFSLKMIPPNTHGNIIGVNISGVLMIMLHYPHAGKNEMCFHIQVAAKLRSKTITIAKIPIVKVSEKIWDKIRGLFQ